MCVLIGTDRRIDQLIRHRIRHILPQIGGDHLQHHVKRRSAACRAHAVAINHENGFRQADFLEFLQKPVLIFPMDRRALAVQQARLGQCIGPRAQPADGDAAPRLPAKPGQNAFGRGLLHIDPATDEDRVVPLHLTQTEIQRKGGPV